MRDWTYGDRDLWLVEQPWWLGLLDYVADHLDPQVLYKIPLAPTAMRQTLGDWMFEVVMAELFDFVDQHPKREMWRVSVNPEVLREIFYEESPRYFDELEGIREEATE